MERLRNILENEFVRHLFISVIVYFFISIVVFFINLSFLNLMLAWNIILAFIPVVLSIIFYQNTKKEGFRNFDKILLTFLFLSWVAFFPNSYAVYVHENRLPSSFERCLWTISRMRPNILTCTTRIEKFNKNPAVINTYICNFMVPDKLVFNVYADMFF